MARRTLFRTLWCLSAKGQTASEYGVIMALGAIVCLGALTLLGQNLNGAFRTILDQTPGQPAPKVAVKKTTPSSGSFSANIVNTNSQSGTVLQMTLQSGKRIAIPDYPKDLSATILTVGANGATDRLLAVLEVMAKKLLAEGEITETQASQLFALANAGHDMAAREKIVEDFVAGNQSRGTLPQTPVTYQGKTYADIATLARSFDVMSNGTAYESQRALSTAYEQAAASGALNDPAVSRVVETLVGEISHLAQYLSEATNASSKSKIAPSEILEHTVSKQTNSNSAGICRIGNGDDTGIRCSG